MAFPGTTYVPHTGHCDILTDAGGAARRPACDALLLAPRTTASTNLQKVLAMTTNKAIRSRKRATVLLRSAALRALDVLEALLRRQAFRRRRREIDDLLPCLAGAREILLAECPDDADIQQRLDVLGIDRKR